MINFKRNLELLVGPLKDYQGDGNSQQAIRILSDGSTSTLRIKANITKSMISIPNASQITIYGLSKETRNKIMQSQASIRLYAWYDGQQKELVFRGGILNCVVNREDTDIPITLISLDGQGGFMRAPVSVSYTNGIQLKDVVKDVAGKIPGVTIDDSRIDVSGQVGFSGMAYAGGAKEFLDRLGGQYGFSWSINNGVFEAVSDKRGFNVETLLGAGVLIKASPILSGPAQQQIGTDIQALYVPGVSPAQFVRLQSSINTELNGRYKVHTMNLNLDTKSDSWTMSIQSYKQG